jgi:ABC-type transport system involved in multi-copper enzyme maturation permease subunit
MKWLVWKELGQNRVIMIVGAALLIMPHLAALFAIWYQSGSPDYLLAGAGYSLALSQLTIALLGGHVIAAERADRSAEFLAYLPLSRARILTGKIMLALLTIALIWGTNLLIVHSLFPGIWQSDVGGAVALRRIGVGIVLTGAVFFSVGWMLSSRSESPTFSICAGLVTPVMIALGIQAVATTFDYPFHEIVWPWYQRICIVVAPVCFVVGTWYYLRRVEP